MEKIDLTTQQEMEQALLQCLNRRILPDCFLYTGECGASSWLALDDSEEFPIASRLTELLRHSASAIVSHVPHSVSLVSIGVGSGAKERILLQALMEKGATPRYIAVDISSPMVDAALETVADLPLEKTGVVAFCEELARVRPLWKPPALLCLLGNNFCNYDPAALLQTISAQLGPGDCFLFDCHVSPSGQLQDEAWRRRVEQAYRSEPNVRFNISPLVRHGLNPDHCAFELDLLPVNTPFGMTLKTRKQIRILADTILDFGTDKVFLDSGEIIRMGYTYKYTLPLVRQILREHHFRIIDHSASDTGEEILTLTTPERTGPS